MNYPYPRADEQLGASMATPGYMIKEHSPRKYYQNAKTGSAGLNPKLIIENVMNNRDSFSN